MGRIGLPSFSLDRRRFLQGTAAAAALTALAPRLAFAATPYSFTQGDFEITVVSDGTASLPISIIAPDAPPEELKSLLSEAGQGPETVTAALNSVLIRKGDQFIIVDAGNGPGSDTAGKQVETLRSIGVEPAAITHFVLTHAHPDHLFGAVGADGALTFPNAVQIVGQAEWDFWTAPDLASKMPAQMKGMIDTVQAKLGAMKEKLELKKPGDEVVSGIRLIDTAGHTPGHLSLEFDGSEPFIITGDAVTNTVVSFARPDWRFGYDGNGPLAVENRRKLLDRAVAEKIKLLGYHFANYPGVGFAERAGDAYRFVPV